MKELKEVQEKYAFFIMINEQYMVYGLTESVKELKREDEKWRRIKRKRFRKGKNVN